MKKNTQKNTILIDAYFSNETRVALVKGNKLIDFYSQDNAITAIKGNIYLAKIEQIEPSLQAVFVNYGGEKLGFLPFNEIHPIYLSDNLNKNPFLALKKDQSLLVQINKNSKGTKGVMMTTYIVISGRYTRILLNKVSKTIISRKIENKNERERLEKIGDDLRKSNEFSIIIRSSSIYKTKKEIYNDSSYLLTLWNIIQEKSRDEIAPSFIYDEGDIILRVMRDLYDTNIESIIISGKNTFDKLNLFISLILPTHINKILQYSDIEPIFSKHKIERQISSIYNNKVDLKNGGYIIINQTEALVAIDVNSGKPTRSSSVSQLSYQKNKTVASNSTAINIDAVSTIVKQVILRDLSGIIVIDFIDMHNHDDRILIEKMIVKAFSNDKAKTKIGKISEFGLLEMTRERIGHSNTVEVNRIICPSCRGRGRVRTIPASGNAILRAISADLFKLRSNNNKKEDNNVIRVSIDANIEIINYLLNYKRKEIVQIEKDYNVIITITEENKAGYDCFFIDYLDYDSNNYIDNISIPMPSISTMNRNDKEKLQYKINDDNKEKKRNFLKNNNKFNNKFKNQNEADNSFKDSDNLISDINNHKKKLNPDNMQKNADTNIVNDDKKSLLKKLWNKIIN
ncbi:ribonuclease E/G [Lyticum sinuosum]|uniref:Ribonuclease G n=1 Tax=Lyticum sinuosum TaxID=1332059 RepID=A0AAE4VLL7_9RICK|nr:ribonuclease E/G [Lyticum sinuosum]MDZ5761542.1 Rne/Rng family ribonuclease [Lyticum sinuosum]